jgi:hypothetical protein
MPLARASAATFSRKLVSVDEVRLACVLRTISARSFGYFMHSRCMYDRTAMVLPVPAAPDSSTSG